MPTVRELARRSEEHMKGMVLPGTHVRGDGLQLHRPHRRARREGAGVDAAEHPQAQGAAVPARGHAQGPGLRAGRGGSDQVARAGSVRSGERHHLQGKERRAVVFADLRPVAVRHGRARPEDRRHHAGDARGLGAGRVLQALSRALLRCGDRRAARGDFRRGPRRRGPEARRRHLFHVPAARLRSVDSRRGAAEPAGGLRAGSRRPGRERRRHPPGQLRPELPALHPEHGGDGAGGRK